MDQIALFFQGNNIFLEDQESLQVQIFQKLFCKEGAQGCLLHTQKMMESNTPYIVLGLLYSYLLYLSWTPDTLQLLFPSNTSWIPELAGIAKMFSREMTLASAWIHLLIIDLFAARQVYHDGLQNDVETRHSIPLILLCCPIGLVAHLITKKLYLLRFFETDKE
ncbi:hypothetical protein AABB24_005053 [Solanum stoloniferum]|uniref:Neoxanthin synthase n=1 Tax=Solanum stoloniferum TaxID=62892 RepID=A0ABD2UVD7_9SOLN